MKIFLIFYIYQQNDLCIYFYSEHVQRGGKLMNTVITF